MSASCYCAQSPTWQHYRQGVPPHLPDLLGELGNRQWPSLRLATTTSAPASANPSTISRPRPLLPPVTITTFPVASKYSGSRHHHELAHHTAISYALKRSGQLVERGIGRPLHLSTDPSSRGGRGSRRISSQPRTGIATGKHADERRVRDDAVESRKLRPLAAGQNRMARSRPCRDSAATASSAREPPTGSKITSIPRPAVISPECWSHWTVGVVDRWRRPRAYGRTTPLALHCSPRQPPGSSPSARPNWTAAIPLPPAAPSTASHSPRAT